ncbi:uncharacterized protein LOC142921714 isoform X3 [Petromyzon marinus]|uniref:uncharacterized protein LOC142918169 isoform X3 n=1 Tax=Petromyzon marinus TaxID=7757 RepID=UPI003F6E5390
MAMSKLYKLGLLFPFILPLLLLHHLVTCSSHAPLFPLNVRLESRDLLATLCWDPVEAAPSGDGGDRPPLVDPLTINSTTTTTTNSTFLNVTYRVQSKLFRRARWQTVCAATTETRCDVSSVLDDPGDRYLLRVRFSFSSSPSRSSPWVAVVVLPLMETVLSAPSFTLRLDKLTRGEEEEEGDGGEDEDEECGVVGDDEDNDDDGYSDNDDGDDDDRDGGDDDRRDDGGPGVAGELEAVVDGEPEVRKLSLLVSVGRGWRALVSHDVKFHHQVDISTRGGVQLTERFIGCRYQHRMMLLPGREDEYCVRVRMVADLPRWKAGEWSPLSCVSVPPPHSTVVPRVGVDTDGQVTAVVGQKVALLRCVLWGAAVVVVQANWLKASRGNVWAGANLAALSPLHGTAYSNSSLAGRLRFRVGGPPGDVSLELLDVRAGDGGLFLCHVATFPHDNFEGRVNLSVIDVDATTAVCCTPVELTTFGPNRQLDTRTVRRGLHRGTLSPSVPPSRSLDPQRPGASAASLKAHLAWRVWSSRRLSSCYGGTLTPRGGPFGHAENSAAAAAAGRASWAAPAAILAVSLALVATLLLLLLLYRHRRQRQRRHEPWGPSEDPPTLPKAPRRNAEGDRGSLLTLESGNKADEGLHELQPQPQHQDSGAGSYDYAVFTDEDDDEAREEDF